MLLHALPPLAAELFTQKLEQADAAAAETGATLCIWPHAMDSYVQMCFMPRTDLQSFLEPRKSQNPVQLSSDPQPVGHDCAKAASNREINPLAFSVVLERYNGGISEQYCVKMLLATVSLVVSG